MATARAENEESPHSKLRKKQTKRNFCFCLEEKRENCPSFLLFPVHLTRRLVRQEIVAELRSTAAEHSRRCDNSPKRLGHCPNFRLIPARGTAYRAPALLAWQVFHPKNSWENRKPVVSLKFFPISTRFSTRRVVNWSSLHTHTNEASVGKIGKAFSFFTEWEFRFSSLGRKTVSSREVNFSTSSSSYTSSRQVQQETTKWSEWKNFFLLLFFSPRGSTARFLGLRSWKTKT